MEKSSKTSIDPKAKTSIHQQDKKAAARTLASCALVCKSWNHLATERLWRDLPSALCLLNVLGILQYSSNPKDKGWAFAAFITDPNRISRFFTLANYVESLNHYNAMPWNGVRSSFIANSALQTIVPSFVENPNHPGGKYMCPKLRELRWASDLKSNFGLLEYLTPPSL
ncbi:hypothetical protein FRB90_001981 [Tulasnella sp. 427]|nr:hypothetical protein FRB90_001981 [Tulasnella sp. 427]